MRRLAAVEDTGQIGVEHLVPFVDGGLGDRLEHADAGVVDQNVEPAERGTAVDIRASTSRITAYVGAEPNHPAGVLVREALAASSTGPAVLPADHHGAPSLRNASAMANPIPRDPPVTNGDLSGEIGPSPAPDSPTPNGTFRN